MSEKYEGLSLTPKQNMKLMGFCKLSKNWVLCIKI